MTDENKAELWPLAYAELQKGDVVSAETIERIASSIVGMRVTRGTDEYGLHCMRLVDMIMAQRSDLRARRSGHNIRVLTDEEYSGDTRRRTRAGIRKILRSATLPSPDAAALTADERAQWDREQSRTLRLAESVAQRERELQSEELMLVESAKRLTSGK
jgi:hypothetical protein